MSDQNSPTSKSLARRSVCQTARMLDYHQLKNLDLGSTTQTYTERDTMLYALSVGVGADPLDERQLSFVYERGLRALPSMVTVPESAPDSEVELASLPHAALLYRLNGDVNPLHVDPAVARAAGFERPILHGLCSFGMAVHAALRGCCDYDAARIRSVAARFTSPVYPGERMTFQFWRGDNDRLHFRARVPARDITVLNRGLIELR